MNTTIESIEQPILNSLKKAIWLYFLFWIFEGALRKWILPSLATPLLVVRDPIAMFIVIRAFYLNIKFINAYVVFAFIFTIFGLAITLTFGHANLFVGVYGARIMLIHFPMIFIIGTVFTKKDVLQMGRVLLVVNLLVTLIVYFQFTSPQTALVNVGIGGEGSTGLAGALGYSRPSGTFSFITGLSVFYTAVSVFIFYFWLSKDACSKIVLYASTITLIIALPLTISRGAVVAVIIVGLFAILAAGTSGKTLMKLIITAFTLFIVVLILQEFTSIFKLGTDVFLDRVDSANKQSGGGLESSILARIVHEFLGPFIDLLNQPLFSGNLGMGTNAGAQMLTGKTDFLITENEFGRIVGEQGVIFGGGLILIRMILTFSISIKSWVLPKEEKLLPFILCGAAMPTIIQGQWAQPSILGFGTIIVGLVLASSKKEENPVLEENK
jgi:hypothetical protein